MAIDNLARWFELNDGVNNIKVSLYEALNYSQTYEKFGGNTVHRMLDGSAVKQTNWDKLRTTLSGSGGIPLGMSGLDYTGALTLKCAAPRSIHSTSNVITLPSARRVDSGYEPRARKVVNGFALPAVVASAGDVYTVVIDAQASSYLIEYFPEISVVMNDPSETYEMNTVTSGWSIVAEEI